MSCIPGDFQCVIRNCSGAVGPGSALFNYWQTHDCPAAYAQALNTNTNTGVLAYSPAGQLAVQDNVVNLFNTYFETNTLTDDVTSPQFNNFQNTLLDLCINPTLPGVCTKFLTGYCGGFTRTNAVHSPTLTNFCGCYVTPDPIYLALTHNPACDPLCHRALTSHTAVQTTGVIESCDQNICAIDQVSVTVQGSNVPGGVNFTTVCPGCGSGAGAAGCLCLVSGVNVTQAFSDIGIGVNVSQFCGPHSVCVMQDNSGKVISTGPCTGVNPANLPVGPFSVAPNIGIVVIVIFIVILVILVILATYFGTPRSTLTVVAPVR